MDDDCAIRVIVRGSLPARARCGGKKLPASLEIDWKWSPRERERGESGFIEPDESAIDVAAGFFFVIFWSFFGLASVWGGGGTGNEF